MHIYIKDRPNSIHTNEIWFEVNDLVFVRDDGKMDRIATAAVACIISDERQDNIDEQDRLEIEADLAMQDDEIEHPRSEG